MSTISRLFSLLVDNWQATSRTSVADEHQQDALILLASLAHADGVLGAEERQALAAASQTHVANTPHALAFLNDPNRESIEDIAIRIRRTWPIAIRRSLIEKATTIAISDGSIGEIEEAMLTRLSRLLAVPMPGPAEDGPPSPDGPPDG